MQAVPTSERPLRWDGALEAPHAVEASPAFSSSSADSFCACFNKTGYTYAPVRRVKPTVAPASSDQSPAPSSCATSYSSGPSTPAAQLFPYSSPSCLFPVTAVTHQAPPSSYTTMRAPPTVFAFDQAELAAAWTPFNPGDVWPAPPSSAGGLPDLHPFGGVHAHVPHVPLSASEGMYHYGFNFGAVPELFSTTPTAAASPDEGLPFQHAYESAYEAAYTQDMYMPSFAGSFDGLDPQAVLTFDSPFGSDQGSGFLGETLAWDCHRQLQLSPTFGYNFVSQ